MIRHLAHKEIEKDKWDACIDNSLNAIIYTYSWYLDIVCPNWEALILDDYIAVMPIAVNKKYGIKYIYPPYFAQQLGVFSKETISQELVENFLTAIPDRYKFIEMTLNTHNTFDTAVYTTKKNTNLELRLDKPYLALQKYFSEDTQRNIKKADKHKVILQKEIDPTLIIKKFRENTGKKITNLTTKHYQTLLTLIHACRKKGFAQCWGAFTQDHILCAGVIWLIKDSRSIFLFSATDNEAKKNGAMFFLINTFIKENAELNFILDFEGSNIPGLARFYKGFGSTEHIYLQVKKNNLPKLLRLIKQ